MKYTEKALLEYLAVAHNDAFLIALLVTGRKQINLPMEKFHAVASFFRSKVHEKG